MKIKVKLFEGASPLEIIEKGDWIDLRAKDDLHIKTKSPELHLIPLGVAMQLPKGYEAIMAPRSSSYKKFGIMAANSIGVIDNSYCGPQDEWLFAAVVLKECNISKGERICQFRVQLNQKASIWQKLKWIFTSGKIKFEYVDDLSAENRKGVGSTGV